MKNILLLLLIITYSSTYAQPYRNLVMEGGGIKGIAYGGALAELEKRGILKDIVRVAGTSAGAIQACLLAIGYDANQIADIIAGTPVESFNDDGFINRGVKRLKNDYGWYQGDEFLTTLEDHIANRTGNRNLTFKELHQLAKAYPFRDLYVVGANLSKQTTTVFSYETYPNMRVADAVRISMSIPLYYKALWIDKEGKVIEHEQIDKDCQLYVDGGILMNYPIGIFDRSRYTQNFDGIDVDIFNNETLGFRLDRCEQISYEVDKGGGIAPFEINDFNTYLSALSSLVMRNVSPAHPKDIDRTIFINDLGKSARVRKVPEEEKIEMMLSGQQGVIDFFTRLEMLRD